MSAWAISSTRRRPEHEWQLFVATGFLALTCLGAVIDRRGAVLDRTFVASRVADRPVPALTTAECLSEMLTHD